MKNLKIIILLILVILVGFVIYMFYNNNHTPQNEVINQNVSNINSDESFSIDEKLLDESVKKAIIDQVVKKLFDTNKGSCAEGHKILKFESKENKIYTYVVSEFGVYKLNKNNIEVVSASACPLTFIFDNNYNFEKVLIPDDQNVDFDSVVRDILFPESLINSAKVNYATEFYQKQIKNYLIKD